MTKRLVVRRHRETCGTTHTGNQATRTASFMVNRCFRFLGHQWITTCDDSPEAGLPGLTRRVTGARSSGPPCRQIAVVQPGKRRIAERRDRAPRGGDDGAGCAREPARAAADERDPDAPDEHQHEALELRRGEPGDRLVVAADELDQEALQPATARGRARTAARAESGRASATAARRRGPSRASRRRASGAPRRRSARCRPDMTSPTAGRTARRSRRRPRAGSRCGRSRSRARAPGAARSSSAATGSRATAPTANDGERAADRAAVPDQPRPGEEVAEQVVAGRRPSSAPCSRRARRPARRPAPRRSSRRPSRPACRAPRSGARSARPRPGSRART